MTLIRLTEENRGDVPAGVQWLVPVEVKVGDPTPPYFAAKINPTYWWRDENVGTPMDVSSGASIFIFARPAKPEEIPAETPSRESRMVASDWQPIETAPKDKLIDLWTSSGVRKTNCYWDHICQEWRCRENNGVIIRFKNVTHWMPLPSPPTDLEGKR